MLRSTACKLNQIQPPIGLNFGRQVGMLLAGHNILIPGKPEKFTPVLSKHFMMIETAMRTPADALYFAHCISTYFSYPHRTDLVALCSQDAQTRLKASIFWGKYLSTTANFNDTWGIIMRTVFLFLHIGTLFPWFVVSACVPGLVHQVLATGADVTWKKYETTSPGTPNHQLYQNHINEMQRLATAHQNAANTSYFCPFTCAFALLWMLVWRASSGAAAPPSNRYQGGMNPYGNAPAPGGANSASQMPAGYGPSFGAPNPMAGYGGGAPGYGGGGGGGGMQ